MKVGLIDVDSKIPNLALMKISAYMKSCGHEVELTSPLFADQFDEIFASKVFTYTEMPMLPKDSIIGGSGYSFSVSLDNNIEHTMPDYSLYPEINYSLGFTTRGCTRKCPFCIVPEKEGRIKINADIYEFWDNTHKKIVLFDNNILALPNHFFKITKQIQKEGIKIDFNQGLDHRFLTDKICKRMSELRHEEYRFSFDDIKQEKTVLKSLRLLKKREIGKAFWFVLVGFNSTIEEDLYRLNLLRDHGQNAYVQRYNYIQDDIYIPLAQWANQQHVFRAITFKQFLNYPEKQIYKKLYKGINIAC